jgi:hypothetical protein
MVASKSSNLIITSAGNCHWTGYAHTDCTYVASSSSFVCYQELEVLGYEPRGSQLPTLQLD